MAALLQVRNLQIGATVFPPGEDPFDIDPYSLIDPDGGWPRYTNDMFDDDLFTPGSRISLFYKTRFTGSTTWFVRPDTTGGNFIEMEVMPSSMAADSTFNCVLFVDRGADDARWEGALSGILTGGSANFENTGWDRYDVSAPGNHISTFGRPLIEPNGASVTQE